MIKVYLNNSAYWFASHAEAAQFMEKNPAASLLEFSQYWNAVSRTWENKSITGGNYEA